jgi:hypothetical protein
LAQTLPGGVPLPGDIPPQPGTHAGGKVWSQSDFDSYLAKALSNGDLAAEVKAAGSYIAGYVQGRLEGGAAGEYNPDTKMITVDTTRLTCSPKYFGEFVETISHEIRHGWQEAMVSQGFFSGHVQMGVSRDPVSGSINYQTFSRSEFRNMGVAESRFLDAGNTRGYLMCAHEIDARMFAEWIRRDSRW